MKVGEKDISAKERGIGQVVSIPHGMVVWSTGIGAHPEVVDFMKQLGQVCFFILCSMMHRHGHADTDFNLNSQVLKSVSDPVIIQISVALNSLCDRLIDVHWSLMNG